MEITFVPQRVHLLTPRQFQNLSKTERSNIERVEFVPPRPGAGHFGLFKIQLKNPMFKPLLKQQHGT